MYEYDLFAVINHEGQMNNGHYTNYARFQDEVRSLWSPKKLYIMTILNTVVSFRWWQVRFVILLSYLVDNFIVSQSDANNSRSLFKISGLYVFLCQAPFGLQAAYDTHICLSAWNGGSQGKRDGERKGSSTDEGSWRCTVSHCLISSVCTCSILVFIQFFSLLLRVRKRILSFRINIVCASFIFNSLLGMARHVHTVELRLS